MGAESLDELAIRAAIEHANLNVLRMALYQATEDPALAAMTVDKVPMRGGAFVAYVLAAEHHAELKEKAVAYLLTGPSVSDLRIPEDAELRTMMTVMTSETLSDGDFLMGREELALEEFPRDARWTAGCPESAGENSVIIVGAGASGIASAIQFERLGIPYTVLERQGEIGGTWNLNHYPQARVDTSSYLYQFKFEKNYPWTEYFASQNEVKRYLEHIAKKYDVYDKIRFNTDLKTATFDERSSVWELTVRTPSGDTEALTSNFVISAAGMFSTPKLPDIPGIDSFRGEMYHTTAWNDDYDAEGRTIALIGNGSTGVQLLSALAGKAEKVLAFQRTPQWISPMELYRDHINSEVRWLFDHVPGYWNWFCYASQTTTSGMQAAQEYDRPWQAMGGLISSRNDGLRTALTQYMTSQLGDRQDLIEKCTPDYAPLARRLVVDNGWYESLLRPDVELITDGIDHIIDDAIVTKDGKTHKVDTIIAAAGFHVTKYLWPTEYTGRGGVKMEDIWEKDGPRAFLSLTVPEFPNLFMFYGPNGQPRAGSFLSWIEIWARYSAQAIAGVIESGHRTIEVKREAFERYNELLDVASHEIIWAKEAPEGKNYYINKFGRQNVNIPWRNGEYYQMVAQPNLDHYIVA